MEYKIVTIYKVVGWSDVNKGWGEATLHLVKTREVAQRIADSMEHMVGAKVKSTKMIVGIIGG